MNFCFCLAVIFVLSFLGTSAGNNASSTSEDSTASTIGNSGLNYKNNDNSTSEDSRSSTVENSGLNYKNNDNSTSEDSRTSTIENSGLNNKKNYNSTSEDSRSSTIGNSGLNYKNNDNTTLEDSVSSTIGNSGLNYRNKDNTTSEDSISSTFENSVFNYKNNDNSTSEVSRSSTIENSGFKYKNKDNTTLEDSMSSTIENSGLNYKKSDKPTLEDSRSSTIDNSGLNYNAGRAGNDYDQADNDIVLRILNLKPMPVPYSGRVDIDNAKNIHRRAVTWDTWETACELPDELTDSEVTCKMHTTMMECNHTCMFGYTFSDGIEHQMECIYNEDIWTPVPEFESCEPFVDCGLTEVRPGGYSCQKEFMDKGPSCEIYCEPYEDIDAVKLATYTCDIEGNWTPKLPFCMTPGSGMDLVPPPTGRKVVESR